MTSKKMREMKTAGKLSGLFDDEVKVLSWWVVAGVVSKDGFNSNNTRTRKFVEECCELHGVKWTTIRNLVYKKHLFETGDNFTVTDPALALACYDKRIG